jgi:hypothetical protein
LGKNLGKDKTYILSGINYIPTILIESKTKYLQIPLELRTYFFNRIIFFEAGFDLRWILNYNYIENNQYLQEYGFGYNIAFGVQQIIRSNIFLNLKAFYSNGFSFEYRKAHMTNCGFEAEIAISIL